MVDDDFNDDLEMDAMLAHFEETGWKYGVDRYPTLSAPIEFIKTLEQSIPRFFVEWVLKGKEFYPSKNENGDNYRNVSPVYLSEKYDSIGDWFDSEWAHFCPPEIRDRKVVIDEKTYPTFGDLFLLDFIKANFDNLHLKLSKEDFGEAIHDEEMMGVIAAMLYAIVHKVSRNSIAEILEKYEGNVGGTLRVENNRHKLNQANEKAMDLLIHNALIEYFPEIAHMQKISGGLWDKFGLEKKFKDFFSFCPVPVFQAFEKRFKNNLQFSNKNQESYDAVFYQAKKTRSKDLQGLFIGYQHFSPETIDFALRRRNQKPEIVESGYEKGIYDVSGNFIRFFGMEDVCSTIERTVCSTAEVTIEYDEVGITFFILENIDGGILYSTPDTEVEMKNFLYSLLAEMLLEKESVKISVRDSTIAFGYENDPVISLYGFTVKIDDCKITIEPAKKGETFWFVTEDGTKTESLSVD